MARVIPFLFAALALVLPAAAQETGASCSVIPGDAERLACYDAVFRALDEGLIAAEVRIPSEQQIPARPVGRAPAEMVLSCTDGVLGLRFRFADQFLSNTNDNAAVTLQVDAGGNIVRNLPVDEANTSVGFATAREVAAFLDTLEGGRNLKVRITPVRQRSQTVTFRLADHAEEIATLRSLCP